jgi:FtsH-binding integral membrane protein
MKKRIKDLYHASLIFENDNTIIYKIIPGIVILLYYVFSDIILQNKPEAVLSRILPISFIVFLLFHKIFLKKKQQAFRLRFYHVFLASLPIMMYWLCFIHLDQSLPTIVSGTILVFFIISLDIKTNKTNTLIIYFAPLIIFLAVIIPLTHSKEQIIIIMNIPPIVIVGYIINRIQNQLRYKTFKTNHLLKSETNRAEQLYEELFINNESLLLQKEEIIKQNSKISEINKELEYRNTQIQKSIMYAYQIQSALLPNEEILRQSFADSFILYYPSNIVSGDFYWVERINTTTFFAVVDCTGHGVPAAFLSFLGNNILSRAIFEKKPIPTKRYYYLFRRRIAKSFL